MTKTVSYMPFGELVFGSAADLFEGEIFDKLSYQFHDMKIGDQRTVKYDDYWELIVLKMKKGYIPIVGNAEKVYVYSEDGNYVICKRGITKFYFNQPVEGIHPPSLESALFFTNWAPAIQTVGRLDSVEYSKQFRLGVSFDDFERLHITYFTTKAHDVICPHEMVAFMKDSKALPCVFNTSENIWMSIVQHAVKDIRFQKNIAKKYESFDIEKSEIDQKFKDFLSRIYYAMIGKKDIERNNEQRKKMRSFQRIEVIPTTTPTPRMSQHIEPSPALSINDSETGEAPSAPAQPPINEGASTSHVKPEVPPDDESEEPEVPPDDESTEPEVPTDGESTEPEAKNDLLSQANYIPTISFDDMVKNLNDYFERLAIAAVGWDARKGTSMEELDQKIQAIRIQLGYLYDTLAHRRYCHNKGIAYPFPVKESFDQFNMMVENLQTELGKAIQQRFDFMRIESIILSYRQAAKHV